MDQEGRSSVHSTYRVHFSDPRRERLFLSSVGFLLTFAAVRVITHAIRAGIGPFRDVAAGGTHIHHLVWGILLLLVVLPLADPGRSRGDPARRSALGPDCPAVRDRRGADFGRVCSVAQSGGRLLGARGPREYRRGRAVRSSPFGWPVGWPVPARGGLENGAGDETAKPGPIARDTSPAVRIQAGCRSTRAVKAGQEFGYISPWHSPRLPSRGWHRSSRGRSTSRRWAQTSR